jgi:hypothetical protein
LARSYSTACFVTNNPVDAAVEKLAAAAQAALQRLSSLRPGTRRSAMITLAVLDVPDELPQIADDIAGIKQLVLAIQAAADGVASDPGVQGIAALAAIIIDRIDALEHRIGLLCEAKALAPPAAA